MNVISLRSVSKSYLSGETTLTVLREADLEIKQGDFAVVEGPSGSGKSTLLNLLGALDAPDSGRVLVGGVNLANLGNAELADFRNEKIGLVFQSYHLVPVLTAQENVAWPLFLRGMGRRQRMKQAAELLKNVGLADHMNRKPGKLSGGQCQRTAIARALACEPEIVLADEPTASLDRKTADDVIDLLATLNRNSHMTFVIATHDPLVMARARRHLRLVDGKICEQAA